MKRWLTFALCCMVVPTVLAQHILERLDMQVVLRQDGSADVKEVRQIKVSEKGSETFITFNNMGDIEVGCLQVSDEQGTSYEVEESWDIHRTRAEKRGRCGYNPTRHGVELCWGLGDAGNRTYEICYTLTNLVKAYNDYDGFCHSFYDANGTQAQSARVEIRLEDDSLTRENAAIWTFGYYGYKGFNDGVCEATADSPLGNRDAIIVLLQLNKGILAPRVKKDVSFQETVKREALQDSDYDLEDAGLGGHASLQVGTDTLPEEEEPDSALVGGISVVGTIIGLGFLGAWISNRKAEKERKRLSERLIQLMGGRKYDELPYYRDLPLDGNLLLSGATLGAVDRIARNSRSLNLDITFSLQQIYNAFILRMVYKDQIKIVRNSQDGKEQKWFRIQQPVQPEKGDDVTDILTVKSPGGPELSKNEGMESSKQEEAMTMYKGYINDAGIEYHLQKMLYEAAGGDHILQPDELKKYVRENPLAWRPFATMLNNLTAKTIDEKNLGGEQVQQVVGFLRYLRDFSLVAERTIEETKLWKEYLVYAAFYGIADQVRQDMKKVAPDVAQLNKLVQPEELVLEIEPLTKAIASTMVFAHAYMTVDERKKVETQRASSSSSSSYERSSGGGGSSSYSGGGGHSGGGGGGYR